MHTAYTYFPEPGTRPLSDIDILIDGRDKERAGPALRKCGLEAGLARAWPAEQCWRPADSAIEPRSLCFVHADDPWAIDLHTSLNRRHAAGSPVFRLDDVMASVSLEQSALSPGAHTLPQPLLLLHLAVHASCGLESLSLLRLVELVLVLRKDLKAGSFSWEVFLDMAEQSGALGCVFPALKLSESLAPGTVPADVLSRSRSDVPAGVLRVIDPLTPADAHRVVRCSLRERFMWAPSRGAIARQVIDEIFPPGTGSLKTLIAVYRTRIWRVARRTLTL
jgi:hypothetical protein